VRSFAQPKNLLLITFCVNSSPRAILLAKIEHEVIAMKVDEEGQVEPVPSLFVFRSNGTVVAQKPIRFDLSGERGQDHRRTHRAQMAQPLWQDLVE
jgi:hypothetical protein